MAEGKTDLSPKPDQKPLRSHEQALISPQGRLIEYNSVGLYFWTAKIINAAQIDTVEYWQVDEQTDQESRRSLVSQGLRYVHIKPSSNSFEDFWRIFDVGLIKRDEIDHEEARNKLEHRVGLSEGQRERQIKKFMIREARRIIAGLPPEEY